MPSGARCEDLGYEGGGLACGRDCRLDPSGCLVPEGCGDGVRRGDEECDSADLGGLSCAALGFAGGTLACTAACRLDTSPCRAGEGCGDGEVGGGEGCDDGNRADCDGCAHDCRAERCGNGILDCGETCDDLNLEAGDGCGPDCRLELVCGNGVLEPLVGEACDGPDLGGRSCEALCYEGGTLGCTDACALDVTACTGPGPTCGDGRAECGEECDGADLRGASCPSLGYSGGELRCTAGCALDRGGCSGLLWYLYEDFEDGAASWTLTSDWEVGAPSGASDEPASAYGGSRCLGTRIGGEYSNDRTFMGNLAISPPVDLTLAEVPSLFFRGWIACEPGADGANVWIRSDLDRRFTLLEDPSIAYNTTIGSEPAWSARRRIEWELIVFDLSAYAGRTVQIAFAMHTDESVTSAGAYADNVTITEH